MESTGSKSYPESTERGGGGGGTGDKGHGGAIVPVDFGQMAQSAVVVSSRSPRDRTQQETLAGRFGVSFGDVGEPLGGVRVRSAGQWQTGAVKPGVEWRAAGPGRD